LDDGYDWLVSYLILRPLFLSIGDLLMSRLEEERKPFHIKILDRIRASKLLKIIVLLAPASIFLAIFFFSPFIIALMYSFNMFKQVVYTYVFVPRISLEYYIRLLDFPGIFVTMQRSFYYAIVTVILTLLLSYPAAYYIGFKLDPKYKSTAVLLFIIPFWVNFLLRTYSMKFVLHDEGLVNTLLMTLGLIKEPIRFLGTDLAVIIVMAYDYMFLMFLPLYGVLEKLDKELLEAAATLGASPYKTFLKVTLPLSSPGIIAGSLLVFIPAVGEFIIPMLVGGVNTTTLGTLIYSFFITVRGEAGWGIGSAAGLIYIIFIMVLSYLYIKLVGAEVQFG